MEAIGSMAGSVIGSSIGGVGGNKSYEDNTSFKIKFDGKEFKFSNKSTMITDIYVDYTIFDSTAGVCVMTIKSKEMVNEGTKIKVTKDFNISLGSKIDLAMGYSGKNNNIFSGYVVETKIDIESGDNSTHSTLTSVLTVKCLDPKWYLMSDAKSNQFPKRKNKKYSAVVQDVLKNSGYAQKFKVGTVDIKQEPEEATFFGDVACQYNETDFDFLKRLAEETGCFFYANEVGELNFISLDSNKKPKATVKEITQSEALKASFQINRNNIPTSVMVTGLNKDEIKELIISQFGDSTLIGSGDDSDKLTKNTSKTSIYLLELNVPVTKAYTDFRAKAIMNLKEIHFAQAEVTVKGVPDFKLGQMISTKGIGAIPGNQYLITGITRQYHSQPVVTFTTTLTLNATRSKPIPLNKKS